MTPNAFRRPDLTHLSFQPVTGYEPVVFTNTDRLVAFRDALLRMTPPVFANQQFKFEEKKS